MTQAKSVSGLTDFAGEIRNGVADFGARQLASSVCIHVAVKRKGH